MLELEKFLSTYLKYYTNILNLCVMNEVVSLFLILSYLLEIIIYYGKL